MSTKPQTAEVPIYDGDDLARLAELRALAEHAQGVANEARDRRIRNRASRLGDDDADAVEEAQKNAKAAQDEYDAFVDEAAERCTYVRLQRLPGRKFRDLMAAHPPRKDNDSDAAYGVNVDKFQDALLEYISIEDPEIRTVVEPRHPTVEDLRAWLDDRSFGELETYFEVAYGLNRSPAADPKALRYSTAPRTSAAT